MIHDYDIIFRDKALECLGNYLMNELNRIGEELSKDVNALPLQLVKTLWFSGIPVSGIEYPLLKVYRLSTTGDRKDGKLLSIIRISYHIAFPDPIKLSGLLINVDKYLRQIIQTFGYVQDEYPMSVRVTSFPERTDYSLASNIATQEVYSFISMIIQIEENVLTHDQTNNNG